MGLLQDLRFAVRLLVKDRWFTLVAVVTLALGIAANNAVFTFVNAVLIRGIPFKDADRIVALGTRDTRNRNLGVSFLDFEDWRNSARSFSDMCLFGQPTLNVSDVGRAPERYNGAVISANIFRLLGVRPLLGPGFSDEDDKFGAPPRVVLGYGVWQTRYGGRPDIIGQAIRIDELLATVVGVMPAGMQFPPNTDVWLPMGQSTIVRGQGRQVRSYQVIGRLANGVTPAQAQGELQAIVARLAHDFPKTNEGIVPAMVPYSERVTGPQIKIIFWSLMGAVAFVLLIACSNVANLLLAKAANRARELSVRISLGASRWRVVRQLLVESVLLAVISGVVGFALSMLGIRWFDAAVSDVGKPYYMEFRLDPIVFAFFAAVCLATGIVFGLAPALHVSKTNVNEVLKEGGRAGTGGTRAKRWTGALIVVNLTLTLVLLAAAGFMIRSFLAMYRMDPGVDTSRLLTMQMALSVRKYPDSNARNAFIKRVDERLAAIGAVESAATTTNWPLGGGRSIQLAIDGRTTPSERQPIVTLLSVGAKYFETVGVHVTRGRAFTEADSAPGAAHAIVNQRFADMFFQGEDPLGRTIRLTDEVPAANLLGEALPPLTIVGVSSPNVIQRDVDGHFSEPDPVAYIPHATNTQQNFGITLLVRTRSGPASATALLREEMRALDPDMPLSNIRTMGENLTRQRWPFRVFGTMFAAFAVIALVLSAVGLYAITAYGVTQRTQEIGVRMALGAEPPQVWWLIARRGLIHLAIGMAIGMPGALAVGRLLQSLLVQTTPWDPATLGGIAALLTVVAIAACYWPAQRATRLDPVVALRHE
jgi:putative ABC transport system permease protein